MTGRSLTEDGRQLLVVAAIATGVTLAATIIAALLIGMVAATRSIGALRLVTPLLLAAAPAVGAFVGSRRATAVVGRGWPAAALGLSSAMVVVVLLAAGALFADGSSVAYAILAPVLGAVAGSALGGMVQGGGRRAHGQRFSGRARPHQRRS